MRYREISESPIGNFDLQGPGGKGSFDSGSTFDNKDAKLLRSPKAKDKIVRAFRNTEQVFDLIFRNEDNFDANDKYENNTNLNQNITRMKAGIHDEIAGVKGKPGVITVMFVGNLSGEDKMPMSAWTCAHKIGHSFQDHVTAKTQWSDQIDTLMLTDRVLEVDHLIYDITRSELPNTNMWSYMRFRGPNTIVPLLTMKSARDQKLSDFEVFPEIIAQYLLNGKITMKLSNPESTKLLELLNSHIGRLFRSIVGKVLVEV